MKESVLSLNTPPAAQHWFSYFQIVLKLSTKLLL